MTQNTKQEYITPTSEITAAKMNDMTFGTTYPVTDGHFFDDECDKREVSFHMKLGNIRYVTEDDNRVTDNSTVADIHVALENLDECYVVISDGVVTLGFDGQEYRVQKASTAIKFLDSYRELLAESNG